MRTISINNGYYNYKTHDGLIIKSRIEKAYYGTNLDIISYNGENYVVGIGEPNLDADKTQVDFTRICTLNILSRYTNVTEHFKLCLSTPPLLYNDQKKELPKYLIGEYNIQFNKINKHIIIEDVKVFPETICAYVSNRMKFKNKKCVILDIGGMTINGCLIDENGNFTINDIFTLQTGMYYIDNLISQYINRKYYQNINSDDIEYFRSNGLYINGSKDNILINEVEYISDIYDKVISEIIKQCNFRQWSINSYEVFITGGGGKTLYEEIKGKYIPHAILSDNYLFDNFNGLELLSKKVFL